MMSSGGKKYKQILALNNMYGKRGQIAIFVIIAVVIVGIILVIYLFPQVNVFISDVNPTSFLEKCIDNEFEASLDKLSVQGGYISPSNSVLYNGNEIQYLCYTSQYYIPCVVQQPLLKHHVENEIKKSVQPKARICMSELKEEYESKGFEVRSTPGEVNVRIDPNSMTVEFLSPMTISKPDEDSQTFQRFSVNKKSKMYDLLLTATNILQFESTLGDSSTDLYTQYYPDLRIEKLKRNGDTIYTVNNVVTEESFTFASRSLVWPEGYGLENVR